MTAPQEDSGFNIFSQLPQAASQQWADTAQTRSLFAAMGDDSFAPVNSYYEYPFDPTLVLQS